MDQDQGATRELVSALMDGCLSSAEFGQLMDLIDREPAEKATWYSYHLLGDVMRSPDIGGSSGRDAAFTAAVMKQLHPYQKSAAVPAAGGEWVRPGGGSANMGNYHWKLAAGFASLAAVTILGWYSVQSLSDRGPSTSLVQNSSSAPIPVQAAAYGEPGMIRDAELDQLLAAHRQFGGASALQKPAGFLRNATYAPAPR